MASKTNVTINGNEYYQLRRKVGMKKNKVGKWVADYRLFYGKSKKEALAKYEDYIKTSSLDAKKPLGQLMEWYIDNVLSVSDLSGNTKTLYINSYKTVFAGSPIAGQPLKDITGADLQAVITGSSAAAATIKQAVKLLRRFYRYAAAQNIAADITADLVLPAVTHKKQDQTIETFTDEELKKFLTGTPKEHRLRLLIVLAINTGARIGELLALTYSDIDDTQIRINKALQEVAPVRGSEEKTRLIVGDTKTPSSVRSIPINEEVAAAVEDHKRWHYAEMEKNGYKTDYVFTTSTGQLYYKSSVRTHYARLCKLVGVPVKGFHTFRHTFGTRLAAAGVPIQTVSKLMGHDNVLTTAKYYINVEDQAKRDAINTLKLS